MIFLSSRFLKKEIRKYWVHPILGYREDGEIPLLIKEQQDYHGRFNVYFRMSVAQCDALLVILETHIKKKTTNFCELSVQGSIYSALCCETKWMNLTIAILDFAIRLYGGIKGIVHCQNTSQNACYGFRKLKKLNPIQIYDGQKLWRQCAMTLNPKFSHVEK